jgi:ubiquinone/menaquinone biosynthesis C-methylase UbiE
MPYYDEIADGYDKLHGDEQANKFNIALSHLKLPGEIRSLDVGCGTGLSYRHLPGPVVGIDPARKALMIAAGRFGHVIQGSGEKLPFRDRTFDLVVAMTVVHNLDDPAAGLSEIARVADRFAIISILKGSKNFQMMIEALETAFDGWDHTRFDADPHDVIFVLTRSEG